MDKRVPQKDKQKKVEDLLTKLGLMKVADTLCGLPNGAIRAISGNIFLFTITNNHIVSFLSNGNS